ncbi:hypothetical protein HRI_002981000 [Hibiscus trionum]|uniref:Uncharacterized protein n=1 Tax=Hibiscus trionum TaxID=183268 RepID=A0A9W7IBK2_HIBTR|nr:hypothetical protein HRI_002981000 [Hibiscus trionum]
MDLEGITWVGHVYQKLEAMCLEAEEIMYQDTVKYVEDQVQTVGASVKRFYSDVIQDVMQDLLFPSSLEPVKPVTASDTAVEKNAGTLKMPKVVLKVGAVKDDGRQLIENSEEVSDVNENVAHVPSCPGSFMERETSYFLPEEDNNSCMLVKSNVENSLLAGTFSETACKGNEFSRCSSFSANLEVPCQQIPTTLTCVSVEEDCDLVEESCNDTESASEFVPEILNDDLQLVESVGIKMDMRCPSSVIGLAESNGQPNKWSVDTSGSTSNAVDRVESRTVPPSNKTGVDESCIVVNEAELHFHHLRESKHRPYQKTVRDVICSRLRSTSARKTEYEQLAKWYGDDEKSDESPIPALTREDIRRSSTHDLLDSEWELL